jgi:hypothetical protein
VTRSFNQKVEVIPASERSKQLQLGAPLLLARGWKERLGILSFMKDSCAAVPLVDQLINKTSLLRTRILDTAGLYHLGEVITNDESSLSPLIPCCPFNPA